MPNTLDLSVSDTGKMCFLAVSNKDNKKMAEVVAFHRTEEDDHGADVQIRIVDHNQEILASFTVSTDGIEDYWIR